MAVKIDPDIELAKELKKSYVGFNEKKQCLILKLEPATPEVVTRHNKIRELQKEGKLKEIINKIMIY